MLQKKNTFFAKTKKINNFTLPILFVLSFLLIMFNKTDYYLINKMKTLGIDVINPISKIISFPVQLVFTTINSINDIKFLKTENSTLKEEIIRLKKWQLLAIKNLRENKAYKKLLNSTNNEIKLIKTALVTSQSPHLFAKTIIINAGSNHNIDNNFIIINERGLIGRILSVTNNNSKVLLINDQNSSIPVKTLDKDFFAIVKGSSKGKYLISSFTKDDNKPVIGDILVTSGNANVYPRDILVGKVVEVYKNDIIILPFADLQNIEFVQVIDNK